MDQRGKLVIGLMLLMAVVLSGYAWWHQYRSNRQCKSFWGSQTMFLIRYAPQVEFLGLRPSATDSTESSAIESNRWTIHGRAYSAETTTDISQAPGLVHARHALVDDASFEWGRPRADCEANWEFALRFGDGRRQVTVAFDTHCGLVWWVEGQKQIGLMPATASAFRNKQNDWRHASPAIGGPRVNAGEHGSGKE